jgi:hypothetical protein
LSIVKYRKFLDVQNKISIVVGVEMSGLIVKLDWTLHRLDWDDTVREELWKTSTHSSHLDLWKFAEIVVRKASIV